MATAKCRCTQCGTEFDVSSQLNADLALICDDLAAIAETAARYLAHRLDCASRCPCDTAESRPACTCGLDALLQRIDKPRKG